MSNTIRFGVLAFLGYALAIVAANWAINAAGPDGVPVGFGLRAPGGVYFAGLVFTLRNLTQQTLGRRFGFLAIVLGALLSAFLSPGISLGGPLPLPIASGLAFLASETADALVWTKLRERNWWARAMGLGDLAGQLIDSALFLLLAFGSVDFLVGQVVGKQWTIWPAVLLMVLWRRRLAVNPTLDRVGA